jgi:hypothetical protein
MHVVNLFLSTVFAAAPALTTSVQSAVTVENCDFVERYQFETFDCPVRFSNHSEKRIRLKGIRTLDAADSVPSSVVTIDPGKSHELPWRVSLGGSSGLTSRMVTFATDEPGEPTSRAYAYGFVSSVLKNAKPTFDFGRVRLSADLPVRTVTLESIESADFRVTGVVSTPDYLDVSVASDGRTLTAKLKRSITWGLHDSDEVIVSTNSERQNRAAVLVSVEAVGQVFPVDSSGALGIVRNDESRDYFIELKDSLGQEIKAADVKLEGPTGDATIVDCVPRSKGCKRIKLHIGKDLKLGGFTGVARVQLPEFKQWLPIRFSGTALPPGIDPVNPDEGVLSAESAPEAPRSSSPDIRSAIRSQVRNANALAPEGHGPLLRWSVADEAAVYGYYILRSDRQDGPFVKVNSATIKADIYETGIANAYQWRDNSAVPGNVYWYSVGTLYRDGRKEDLTSPQRVVAKPLPESKTH